MTTIPIRDLNTMLKDISVLKPSPRNARTHSKKQVGQIAESIKVFGWTNPVLVDGDDNILAGHGRVEAATLLGLSQVPAIALTDMTEAQKRAYIIADNKLAENAGWDDSILGIELGELAGIELGFDFDVIGFETGEIDVMLGAGDPVSEAPPPEPAKGPPISSPGDLWILGEHKLLCGDALAAESYQRLLQAETAAAIFTDPPYNVPVHGHVCGLGKVRHDEFVMASGEMSDQEFRDFLKTFCRRAGEVLKPGAVAFVCMDWRHIGDLLETGEANLGELINFCVWNKMQGGMGSLYRSQHELVPVFRTPGASHRNNVELGRHGRNRTNVWDYKGVQARRDELKLHPTVKPIAMIADAIQDVTARGELVLDPFAGSGSTILAAEQTGRKARCLELDPRYVDVAIRRYQETTGKEAEHAIWGQSFNEIEAERKEAEDV